MRNRISVILIPVLVVAAGLPAACGDDNAAPAATSSPADSVSQGTVLELNSLDTAELVELLRPSVVHVKSEAATLDVFGQLVPSSGVGTGFITRGTSSPTTT